MNPRAMFRCNTCHRRRQYGTCPPDDLSAQPLLRCSYCGTNTRHTYTRMNEHFHEPEQQPVPAGVLAN